MKAARFLSPERKRCQLLFRASNLWPEPWRRQLSLCAAAVDHMRPLSPSCRRGLLTLSVSRRFSDRKVNIVGLWYRNADGQEYAILWTSIQSRRRRAASLSDLQLHAGHGLR